MSGFVKTYLKDDNIPKNPRLQGNFSEITSNIKQYPSNQVVPFFTPRILISEQSLGSITSVKAKKVKQNSARAFVRDALDTIIYESETVISDPETFVTKKTGSGYNAYYSIMSRFLSLNLAIGWYVFEFGDGTDENTFETEMVFLNSDVNKPLIFTTDQSTPGSVNFTFFFIGSLTVDWGDGSAQEAFTSGVNKSHDYASAGAGEYQIKVTGDINTVTRIIAASNKITSFANRNALAIIDNLNLATNGFAGEFDISGLVSTLEQLVVNTNPITILDVSNALILTNLLASSTDIDVLDVSAITTLGVFTFTNNNLTSAQVDAVWNALRVGTTQLNGLAIGGGNNDAPTAASLASRNSLIADGWALTI